MTFAPDAAPQRRLHPLLFHLGHIAFSTQGILIAAGLLAGLELSSLLASHLHLAPDRIWNLGLVSLLTLFLSQRLLVIAFHLRDFLDHPFWMLGLTAIRDERYFYAGALLAICAGCAYIAAWRLPWLRVLDCVAPGAGLALACASLGSFAAGADFGRVTAGRWGIVYTSRIARLNAGTPLGVPLTPVTLYAAGVYLGLAGIALWLARNAREGSAAACWLFGAGLGTVLLNQLRYRFVGEPLIAGAFTPAQSLGIAAVAIGAALLLRNGNVIRAAAVSQ